MEQKDLKILLVGNGGREHAIAWKLAQSNKVSKIYLIPGNGGTATLGHKVENIVNVSASDFKGLLDFAVANNINLLVPGPEAPLVDGIVDYFEGHGPARIKCFGPSKTAARMEGSKVFAKNFMQKFDIPTAKYKTFTKFEDGKRFLEDSRDCQWVIKVDGLAAGKGVIIPETHEAAVDALGNIMNSREFGAAGDEVVIEEFLEGEEISILTFSDGYTVRSLPAAQDHKRANDNDEGKNTGGMGAYAPASVATPEVLAQIDREVIKPTIDNMRNAGMPFVGCLFTGFVLTSTGPKVLEYNVRFGDPECQTLLSLLDTDLADIMLACVGSRLSSIDLKLKSAISTTVVLAAGGYPDSYAKGTEMTLDPAPPDTQFFHAGTTIDSENVLRTSGGRVIAVTALGSSVRNACDKAYNGVKAIQFDRMHYRRDIAHRELRRREQQQQQDGGLTYASAGVSIEAGNELVQSIKESVASTKRPGADATIGGFGGVFSMSAAGYGEDTPDIIAAIDGIGTKIFVALALANYTTIGIDLVAMNVNDLIVQGAEPLLFLDYYACSKLDPASTSTFVASVAEGCKQSRCALVGGETAEMPGLYRGKDWDAAGCAVGALRKGARLLPDRDAMVPGDVLLGLASSGVHSNGFSLVRAIVERAGLQYTDAAPWDRSQSVGEALLTPTRIYVRALLAALQDSEAGGAIKGLAHITGGGLRENVPRMLPEGLAARIVTSSWKRPAVFGWLKEAGRVSSAEMARTFNCGIGMVCAVDKAKAEVVQKLLEKVDPECKVYRIGALEQRGSKTLDCIVDGSI